MYLQYCKKEEFIVWMNNGQPLTSTLYGRDPGREKGSITSIDKKWSLFFSLLKKNGDNKGPFAKYDSTFLQYIKHHNNL